MTQANFHSLVGYLAAAINRYGPRTGALNGNSAKKLACNPHVASYYWSAHCGRGCRNDGLVDLYNWTVCAPYTLDRSECGRLDKTLGSISVHPVEPRFLLSGCIRSAVYHDQPESPG